MFGIVKKKKSQYVEPSVSALEEARDLVDRVNALYQSDAWPRSHRLWFDLTTRPPRLTIQLWQPAAAAQIVYPVPDLRNSR